jgi:DNA-binding SARP family transcriptional activator
VGSRNVDQNAWRLKKAASLVKLLALAPGHRLHREQAMNLLWPDSNRSAAANSLHKALHAARRTFDLDAGSRYLVSVEDLLVLCPNSDLWVDVEAFEEAAAAARRAKEPAAYRVAVELYAGTLLPEDRYEEWAENRREELQRIFLSLLVELAGTHEQRGEYGPAAEMLRRAVTEEPTLEEAHAALMRLYALWEAEGCPGPVRAASGGTLPGARRGARCDNPAASRGNSCRQIPVSPECRFTSGRTTGRWRA